jgi:hypothetical protein
MRRMDAVKRRVSFADLQRMPDDGRRRLLLERAGPREYSIVDPAASGVDVYVLEQGRFADPVRLNGVLVPHTVPQLSVNLPDLFRA